MVDQGVPRRIVKQFLNRPTQPLIFSTGNGQAPAEHVINMKAPNFGTTETFILRDSPFAVSCGETVVKRNRPFIWLPHCLPFHVTDASKLEVRCPLKYRQYADRVEGAVPIF